MPTNLPPEYFEIEKRYKEAQTSSEKISLLEELISSIPKHKGTDKLRAGLRKRLSKMKEGAQTKKGQSGTKSLYSIPREGGGQVVLIGMPNSGKSSILNALTHASPEVADYPFTTRNPSPGMMPVKDIQIQLIDTPPLHPQHPVSEMFDLIRGCDLVLLILDIQTNPLEQLHTISDMLREKRIVPEHIQIGEDGPGRLFRIPFLAVANKNDSPDTQENLDIFTELLEEPWPVFSMSTRNPEKLESLREKILSLLNIIRVYSKTVGKPPSMEEPFVLKEGQTVLDFASRVHKDFASKLKTARIWGEGVHDGQRVNREHVLHDGDIVELHI